MKRALMGAAIALIAVNAPGLSVAQTPMTPPAVGGDASFPPKGSLQAQAKPPAAPPANTPASKIQPAATDPASLRPVSPYQMQAAADQADGYFPPLARGPVGGQIQESWNKAAADAGVQLLPSCGGSCVYRVLLRQYMTTTIQLPADAEILSADLGDNASFQVAVRGRNMIAVKPLHYGVDTNINVYTKSGNVYAFYLRAENPLSGHVPDLLVRVQGSDSPGDGLITLAPGEVSPLPGETAEKEAKAKEPPLSARQKSAVAGLAAPTPLAADWVREIPFRPDQLHGFDDYELWGDEELKPVRVFRDRQFTYIQYGDKWDSTELPTGYMVIDDTDEVVNTRVQGTTFIVESVAPLISLKLGKKYLCIKYTGDGV